MENRICLCYTDARHSRNASARPSCFARRNNGRLWGCRIMEFRFETQYTAKTMAVMARALRKTIRKKRSRRSHIFGWVVFALGVLLVLVNGFALSFRTVITLAAAAVILFALLFEDRINGYVASKQLLPGMEKAVTVFSEGGFTSTTDVGTTEWKYDKIAMLAETAGFFVFIFSASHAQLYDKQHLQGGTAEEFRHFIEQQTGKPVQQIQ